MLDFPNSPSVGQTFVSGATTWTWDGTKWVAAGASGASSIYLPLTGGTLTGPLTVNAPTSHIDNAVIGGTTPAAASVTSLNGGPLAGHRNRLINGAMLIDQRGAATGGLNAITGNCVIDRWKFSGSQANKIGAYIAQTSLPPGTISFLAHYVLTTTALAASDYFATGQTIEANNMADLAFGTASAKPVMLSFWAYSALVGTHSGSLSNDAATRSYPFTFTLAANTWTPVAITIPGDIAGTWVAASNAAGMLLRFNLGSGSTYLGTAGAWASGNYIGATGSVQVAAGVANSDLRLTNVQLEPGTVATPFERRLFGTELSLCQRYYQVLGGPGAVLGSVQIQGYAGAATNVLSQTFPISPPMRIAPAAAFLGTWTTANCSAPTMTVGFNSFGMQVTAAAAGQVSYYNPANGGITLNAEL